MNKKKAMIWEVPVKVVIAIDSFKGSLSSVYAGEAAAYGIRRVFPEAEIRIFPVADGGEGTTVALATGMKGELRTTFVSDPLGNPTSAMLAIIGEDTDHKTAVIEMSMAAGLTLIEPKDRDPMETTTYGVGELIREGIARGCRSFIIGIGGSATNDGGIGMLRALGASFLNADGKPVSRGGIGLCELEKIDLSAMPRELSECSFTVACDVTNPLCGNYGCSRIYAPQKGADEKIITDMDAWLKKYAELTKKVNPNANPDYPGAGAAGGLGFAFLSYLGATLKSGIDIVIAETKLENHIKDADFVITGEGRLDGQSLMGKAPIGVATLAKKYGKPVIALAGGVSEDAVAAHEYGIDAIFPIVRGPIALAEAMREDIAKKNISATAEQIFRLINAK